MSGQAILEEKFSRTIELDRLADKDVVSPTLDVRQGKRIVQMPTRVIELGKVEKERASPERVGETLP